VTEPGGTKSKTNTSINISGGVSKVVGVEGEMNVDFDK
jgi:hypothetical protein